MNFLHRGALTFDTLVYDTNVGDIRFQKISESMSLDEGFDNSFCKMVHAFVSIIFT